MADSLDARLQAAEARTRAAGHAWAAEASAYARSALRLAESRASRDQDKAGANQALGVAQQKVGEIQARQTEHPELLTLVAVLWEAIKHTARVVVDHLARAPEQQQQYKQGVEAADRSWSTYRDYSDTRRSWVDDVAEASAKTRQDLVQVGQQAADLARARSLWLIGGLILGGVVVGVIAWKSAKVQRRMRGVFRELAL